MGGERVASMVGYYSEATNCSPIALILWILLGLPLLSFFEFFPFPCVTLRDYVTTPRVFAFWLRSSLSLEDILVAGGYLLDLDQSKLPPFCQGLDLLPPCHLRCHPLILDLLGVP